LKLTRSGAARNWNALPGARVIFETVEKVAPAGVLIVFTFGSARRPLGRALAL
jgi:hypothetical protein